MTPPGPRPSPVPDVLSALATALWYALPDYSRSRRTRALVKAGILAAGAAYGYRVVRERPPGGPGLPPEEPASTTDGTERWSARSAVAFAVAAVVALGSTAAGTVYVERVVYRLGERLSQGGVRYAHTRIGAVLGALSLASTIVIGAVGTRLTRAAAEPSGEG